MNVSQEEAYRRLGVDQAAVRRVAQITPTLKRVASAIRKHNPNLPRDPIFYLRACADVDAKRVLEVRASLPKCYQKMLPLEAFCVAASVDTLHIQDVIQATVLRMGAQFDAMLAAVSHGAVVDKTIEIALTDEGIDDRMALHKATGFIPTPRGGPTINVRAQANAASVAQTALTVHSAPPPEQTIRRLSDRLNALRGVAPAARALPESTATELPTPSEFREAELVRVESQDQGEEGDDY